MSFIEITISDGLCEVMVDIDVDTGDTKDIYTYIDGITPCVFCEVGEWTVISNPLFAHLDRTKFDEFAKLIPDSTFAVIPSDLELLTK